MSRTNLHGPKDVRVIEIRLYIGNKTNNKGTNTPIRKLFSSPSLRKHAYLNILKIFPPKNENFQIKNSDIFHISAQNIDCGYSLEPPRRGGSNEYHKLCFEQK